MSLFPCLVPNETLFSNLGAKGRPGILACASQLSHLPSPSPPVPASLQDSLSEWTLIGEKEGLQTPSSDTSSDLPDHLSILLASLPSGADLTQISSEPVENTLEQVLDLHTFKRMKPSLSPSRYRKPKMGASIPSQQRWSPY